MKLFSPLRRLRNISIAKKLYFIVGTMAVLIAIELFTLWFAITTLSSVRAFVGAEGLWSKAQKDAVYSLSKYYRTRNEDDYQAFLKFMSVPLGDHKTRLELMKVEPDMEIARKGFVEGRIDSADIDGMIALFRRFNKVYYIHRAIEIWTQGDSIIAPLIPLGEAFHKEISLPNPSQARLDALLDEMNTINHSLTILEDEFSYTLGEGSRWLENLILKLLLSIVMTVEITGLTLSITVSRSITKGLNAINKAADKVKSGHLEARAPIFSKDEIGQVATSMNEMTEQLIASHDELEAFIYRASHDLKGPLSTTRGLLGLAMTEGKSEYLPQYFEKMKISLDRLDDILNTLHEATAIRQGSLDIKRIDVEATLHKLINDFRDHNFWERIKFHVDHQLKADFHSDEVLLRTVMRNVLENGIKYHRIDIDEPIIKITIEENGTYNIIKVSDNGIGIDPAHRDKIFKLFYRGNGLTSGSGLGLYIVKKAMDKLNGKVEMKSSGQNQGTTFEMHFPKGIAS
jgi:signal transduction histidine kinase